MVTCGSKDELNVHHKNYQHLKHEHTEDLLVLCRLCHANQHFFTEECRIALHIKSIIK